MALIVDVNTYTTVQEADQYIQDNYPSTDANRLKWDSLSEEDKEVYLRKACRVIEHLPLKGIKLDSSQLLQFPRKLGNYTSEGEECEAQIVQAMYMLDNSLMEGLNRRMELRKQGVRRVSIGNVSESYFASAIDYSSSYASSILSFWLKGGYEITTGGGCDWIYS